MGMAAKVYKGIKGKREKEPCHLVGAEFRFFSLVEDNRKRQFTISTTPRLPHRITSHRIFHLLPSKSLSRETAGKISTSTPSWGSSIN
jgi:hypothetical protein